MNKRLLIIVGFATILFLSFYIGSPYFAANSLKNAAIAGDVDSLEAGVDFPAVQESLKAQMTVALMTEFKNDPKMQGNPFAGLGAMMMPAIIDRAVSSYVTPEGISALVKGAKPGQIEAAKNNSDIEFATDYSGLDRFRVHTSKRSNGEKGPTFLFERRGIFTWKMIKIELPADFMKRGSTPE
ncbi:MAG: DUF2939 domain-containing protein [Novosphingobium sp.]